MYKMFKNNLLLYKIEKNVYFYLTKTVDCSAQFCDLKHNLCLLDHITPLFRCFHTMNFQQQYYYYRKLVKI